jgi:hypothetical protein
MDNQANHVVAIYSPQRINRFQGNPLIEALPPTPSEDQLIQMLTRLPDFSPEQRSWPTAERLNQVMSLNDFLVPLARHVQLAFTLDSMLRQGYVGRAPRTAAHTKVFQGIYEAQKTGTSFTASAAGTRMAALSTSLVGVSGMGKTRILQRLQEIMPAVIYHPDLRIWQIPYLRIETPHDGASVKGLCHSILRQIDNLIPDANYYELYAKPRASVETLLNDIARILHIHSVGVLILDEIQNLENAPKNKQSLMTLLVSASNELGVPIVFVGTNKARRVLSLDFRQARRSIGQGLAYWDRLAKKNTAENDDEEWDSFIKVLWHHQWVKTPIPLNDYLSDLMYQHTQGIIDLTIKLFAACQWRAMLDGSETITAQLIESVAKTELALVQPMVEALRKQDLKALEAYDDIAPIDMEVILRSMQTKLVGKRLLGASIRPGDPMFGSSLTGVITALGVEAEQADALASQIETIGTATNVLDATKQAIEQMMPPKRVRNSSKAASPEIPLEPCDLRNAIQRATKEGTTAFEQLQKMGAVCDLRKVLAIG